MFSWWDIGDWNTELTLFSSLQIMPRKYSAVKYVQRCFGKDKMSWWDSIQNKRLSSDWKGPYEKGVLRNFPKITRKHFSWNLFIDKVRYCRSATSFKTRLEYRFFLWILWNFKKRLFAEHQRKNASDYSSINSNKEGIGKQNILLRKSPPQWNVYYR